MGLLASRTADHGHMKEAIVDDLDTLGAEMLGEMFDLLMMDSSRPVEFRGGSIGPECRHGAIAWDLVHEWTRSAEQVERGFKGGAVQAFEQVQELSFAPSAVHGGSTEQDAGTRHIG